MDFPRGNFITDGKCLSLPANEGNLKVFYLTPLLVLMTRCKLCVQQERFKNFLKKLQTHKETNIYFLSKQQASISKSIHKQLSSLYEVIPFVIFPLKACRIFKLSTVFTVRLKCYERGFYSGFKSIYARIRSRGELPQWQSTSLTLT